LNNAIELELSKEEKCILKSSYLFNLNGLSIKAAIPADVKK